MKLSSKRLIIGRVAMCLLAIAFPGIVGCGDGAPERYPVSGTVLIDGKPLTHGLVTFYPTSGRSSFGQVNAEGRFTLSSRKAGDGVLPGSQRVTVKGSESLNEKQTKWHAPKKYANQDTSGIVIEITEPVDDLQIELSWGAEKPSIETDG